MVSLLIKNGCYIMSIYNSIYKPRIKIKDKIHDYITLTEIEYQLLETQIFQRLKYISQSGFIHTVYPSNRISRFEHSLGCMYLSGLFIENMFSNSLASSILSIIKKDAEKGITIRESFLEDMINQYSNTNEGKEEFKDYINFLSSNHRTKQTPNNYTIIEAVIWQAVRIAGLLHDLGHLPFSHDMEIIINKNINLLNLTPDKKIEYLRYYNGKYHEFATINLINSDTIIKCFDKHKPLHNIVLRIFLSKNKYRHNDANIIGKTPNKDIYYTLREIVDSDIDADRGDYLKRDGNSSGVEMGNYDLNRLVQNIELMMNTKKEYFIRPTQYASSIVEQFLMERYHIYKYVHFHQKSVFVNTLISRIVSVLLAPENYNINIQTRIEAERLNYSNYILTDKKRNIYEEPFDDISIISLIRKAYGELCAKEDDVKLNENEEFVKQLIGIALYRKKNYIPLWKKNEDYLELYNSIMKPIFDKNLNKSFSLYDLSKTYFSDLSSIEQFEEIINKYIPSELNAKIIISPRHFTLSKDDYFIINTKNNKWSELNIKEFAPLLSYANDVWKNSVQIFCYAILKKEPINNEITKHIQILTDSFAKGICDWLSKVNSY